MIETLRDFVPRFAPGSTLVPNPAKEGSAAFSGALLRDDERHRLFVIEFGSPAHAIDEARRDELERLFAEPGIELIFVTVFQSRKSLADCAGEIAWNTVVWIVDEPDHLIEFGGPLLGPYPDVDPNQRARESPKRMMKIHAKTSKKFAE